MALSGSIMVRKGGESGEMRERVLKGVEVDCRGF